MWTVNDVTEEAQGSHPKGGGGGIWEIGQTTTNILRKPKLLVKSHPLGWRPETSSLTSLMVHTVFFVNIGIKKFAGRYRAFGYGILFPKLY